MSKRFRVWLAARRLDRMNPGWRSLVKVEKLDFGSAMKCLLGQVFAEEGREVGRSGFFYGYDRFNPLLRPAFFGSHRREWEREIGRKPGRGFWGRLARPWEVRIG